MSVSDSDSPKSNPFVVRDDLPDTVQLTANLNKLLHKLSIPLILEAPYELTPSLLLAILECITRQRLPIPQAVRRARDVQSKIQAMKIFLGVLDSDILHEDVGLSDVDPRRLAAGEWDECVFVGEVLCWLAKHRGLLPHANVSLEGLSASLNISKGSEKEWHQTRHVHRRKLPSREPSGSSSSTPPTARNSLDTSLSRAAPGASMTDDTTILTLQSQVEPDSEPDTPSLSDLDLFDAPSRIGIYRTSTPPPPGVHPPRDDDEDEDEAGPSSPYRIPRDPPYYDDETSDMDMPDASQSDASSYCHCPSENQPDPNSDFDPESPLAHYTTYRSYVPQEVHDPRHQDWIEEADEEEELRTYYASRSARMTPSNSGRARHAYADTPTRSFPGSGSSKFVARPAGRVVTRHTSPTQYTLALMTERAKLMSELSSLKQSRQRTSTSPRDGSW